ncbi:MAG: hypothetical protein QOC76_4333 [Mycobacterium sp.]|jgi:NAD(P)-dependent dehydrogenase (short-subunit alcohol dehydrogenase family)|nr:hypothetical protein [Mycobacterium sp.]
MPCATTVCPGSRWRRSSSSHRAGRIGTVDDVAEAVLFALTNTFLTGMTLKVDGGEPLI